LVARADAEEAVERGDGKAPVGQQPDLQSIVERVLLDGEVLLVERHGPLQSSLAWPAALRASSSCSAGVRSFLRVLQGLQLATTFPFTLRPPRATGTT